MSAEPAAAICALNDAVWAAVAARPDVVTGERVSVPPPVSIETPVAESRYCLSFRVLERLPAALELARESGFGAIVDAFIAVVDELRWSQNPRYTEATVPRALLDGYCYAALSGPEGPVLRAAPRGGLMLMGPRVTYPDHNHAPREVYLVMTPGMQWRLDHGEWFDVPVGSLVYHRSWQWHSMRTTTHPLLAFTGWVEPGDRHAIDFSNGAD